MILPAHVIASSPVLSGLEASALEFQLEALELRVRRYTHNTFRVRGSRVDGPVENGAIVANSRWYAVGDRVDIVGGYTPGLHTVTEITDQLITLDKPLDADDEVSLWKVEYPADVIMGLARLLEYDNDSKAKKVEGLSSQSLSRHSVTYNTNHNTTNASLDFPARLTGFLKGYIKARF